MTEESQELIQNEESPDEAAVSAEEWQDRYLRLAAELDNSRKAYERAYAHRAQQERERFIRDLLPLADNLERALEHAIPSERETSLYGGIELTLRDLWRTTAQAGKPGRAGGRHQYRGRRRMAGGKGADLLQRVAAGPARQRGAGP